MWLLISTPTTVPSVVADLSTKPMIVKGMERTPNASVASPTTAK